MVRWKRICIQYKDYWIYAALIMLMTAVTGICHQISVYELLIFICFQFFCILIPGIAIMILLPIRNIRGIEKVLLAYVSGYIFTMLIYTLVMIVDGRRFLRIVFAVMTFIAVAVVIYVLKKTDYKATQQRTDDKLWILTVGAVFLLSLIVYSLRWKIPYLEGINTYNKDQMYWMEDIVALTKQIPPLNFRSMAENYRYHYFGALQQAAVSSVTGIPAVRIAICYSYIESSILLGLSSYALADRMIKSRKIKVITLFLMLMSTGFEEESLVTYIWHIYLVPMSYNIAQSLGLVVILLLLIQLKEEKIDVNNLIIMMCCLLCCTGTKSATGAIIFCGFLIAFLYILYCQRNKRRTFIFVFGVLAIFVLIGIYLMPTVRHYSFQIRLPEINNSDGKLAMIISLIYSSVDLIIGYIRYLFLANPWTYIPAAGFIAYSVICKSIKKEYIIIIAIAIIGTICGYLVIFYGHSQMYFALTVFPFAALLTGCWLESISPKNLSESKKRLLTATVVLLIVSFSATTDYGNWFAVSCNIGIQNLVTSNIMERGTTSVSPLECQAYDWIRENTDENVLLLSDRKLEEVHDPTGIFAERYVYCFKNDEEMEIVKAGFDGDEQMVEKIVDLGIDYIVQTKRNSPMYSCPENIGEIVYENDEVSVFKFTTDKK